MSVLDHGPYSIDLVEQTAIADVRVLSAGSVLQNVPAVRYARHAEKHGASGAGEAAKQGRENLRWSWTYLACSVYLCSCICQSWNTEIYRQQKISL
jgi:hypothetical protein